MSAAGHPSFVLGEAGASIAYSLSGKGLPVVLPHRYGGWYRYGYVDALASSHRVLVVDPRGFGDSTRHRSADDYTLKRMCDDLLAAADACAIEQFTIWGYSNTALLACVLASMAPERVSALVCGGMTPFIDGAAYTDVIESLVRTEGEGSYLPRGRFDWRATRAFWDGVRDWQAGGGLRALSCPAVLYYGTNDAAVAPSVHERELEALGFTVVPVEGLDHGACHERSDRTLADVLSALERVGRRNE